MDKFVLQSDFRPVTEQMDAVDKLARGIEKGEQSQVLLGVTGSGKTFTLANVIARINRPTLVISHNKTLAAQLYSEFKGFFPKNAVEYFVSYYDYYQPEAYVPQTDVYIEKDASINDRLDRLRLSSTTSLMSRRDVLIVASVSCIYNLGSPQDYKEFLLYLEEGQMMDRDEALRKLADIQYERNDHDLARGKIRVRGDTLEVYPAYKQEALRVQFFGDTIEKIAAIDPVSGNEIQRLSKVAVYPAKHFITSSDNIDRACVAIKKELEQRLKELKRAGKYAQAERLASRTRYDMEMLKEVGYCHGIENYSCALSLRPAGSRPFCLLDYFLENFITLIDESHVTIPQLNGMYEGDKLRKETLVEYGFRLPSCLDNRPLKFSEFIESIKQRIYVSATPGPFEKKDSRAQVVEQIIRPTGIVDPPIEIRPTKGQVDDLMEEIRKRAKKDERVLVTTLTKRMSEDLSQYLEEHGLKVKYVHSDIETIGRMQILKDLRLKKFDCLVGVNLLREGLDLPEVSLVAIFDADKEGFLRSQTSLIQVAGRAARNINGLVIMYADRVSAAMRGTVKECERRRKIQTAFNKTHGITPRTIQKAIRNGIEELSREEAQKLVFAVAGQNEEEYTLSNHIARMEREMELAARNLQFERAALIRDRIKEMKSSAVAEHESPSTSSGSLEKESRAKSRDISAKADQRRGDRMILAVDIGNTTIACGVCAAKKILAVYRLDTFSGKTRLTEEMGKLCGRIYRRYPSLRAAVICSVVPEALTVAEKVIRRKMRVKPMVIGRDIKVPIKNNYKDPRQVGQDRLVGAYAAKCLYKAPCLIIDFGTAITFDIVSARGEYEGGIIIPGLRLSAESLFQKTALLPRIDTIRAPRSLIGKDTTESILSGLFNGYGAMCRGLIDRIAGTMSRRPRVIITGGHTRLMQKFIRKRIHKIDQTLVFKGIVLIHQNISS